MSTNLKALMTLCMVCILCISIFSKEIYADTNITGQTVDWKYDENPLDRTQEGIWLVNGKVSLHSYVDVLASVTGPQGVMENYSVFFEVYKPYTNEANAYLLKDGFGILEAETVKPEKLDAAVTQYEVKLHNFQYDERGQGLLQVRLALHTDTFTIPDMAEQSVAVIIKNHVTGVSSQPIFQKLSFDQKYAALVLEPMEYVNSASGEKLLNSIKFRLPPLSSQYTMYVKMENSAYVVAKEVQVPYQLQQTLIEEELSPELFSGDKEFFVKVVAESNLYNQKSEAELSSFRGEILADRKGQLDDFILNSFTIHKKNNQVITGSFELENPNNQSFDTVYYETSVYINQDTTASLLGKKRTKFTMQEREKKEMDFEHSFDAAFPTGNYIIILKVTDATGVVLATTSQELGEIKGSNQFILQEDAKSYFLYEGQKRVPLSGPNYAPLERPDFRAYLKNLSEDSLEVRVLLKAYKRNETYDPQPVITLDTQTLIFKPKEEKESMINFPDLTESDSYLVKMVLVDAKSPSRLLSGEIYARFVVSGYNAKILTQGLEIEKDQVFYQAQLSGPADISFVDDVKLDLNLYDERAQKNISNTIVDIGTLSGVSKVRVPLMSLEGQRSLRVTAILKSKDAVLDQKENVLSVSDMFNDIYKHPYQYEIQRLAKAKILNGFPDGAFRPKDNMTRAEFSAIVYQILRENVQLENTRGLKNFEDLEGHWAADVVQYTFEKGIIKGYPDATFKPNHAISYAEVLSILVNLSGNAGMLGPESWPDNVINAAKELSLLSGIDIEDMRKVSSRGDIAKLVSNMLVKMNRLEK